MRTGLFTILVNTCDAFADCWDPFFKLLNCYWPSCDAPIILNTEVSCFNWPGLSLTASRVALGSARRLPWSERLLGCLEKIDPELVLYVQEDYFLKGQVAVGLIEEFATLMRTENIATVQLTPFGSNGRFRPAAHPLLWVVGERAPYRIALQAALWKKERLQFYLREHENPWQFEIFGTLRSWRTADSFYALNRDIFGCGVREVFPYVKTGIIKGQWYAPAVVELFRAHKIDVDFSRRGFFRERSRLLERFRTLSSIMRHPGGLMRSLR
jgi:hypothetical protein